MTPFEFTAATRILFGAGVAAQVGPIAAAYGGRALVVTGRDPGRAAPVLHALHAAGLRVALFSAPREPTVADAEAGVELALREDCELVVAVGGGSPLDAGKAIAALMRNPGDPRDFLEVIGGGLPLVNDAAPFIAVPTTAGTGSEVTRNAVLGAPERRVKVSLRSPTMLPRAAIVDPTLTLDLPPRATADCGLDALTQLIEPFVSLRASPMTDALCRDGIPRAARALRRAVARGDDLEARSDMSLASLFGGLALANAGLGAVHGLAGPIGGMCPGAAHGAVCARLLPEIMRLNIAALRARAPESPALARYLEVARMVTGDPHAAAEDGITWVLALVDDLRVRPLGELGLTVADLAELLPKAQRASSMKGNPVALAEHELIAALVAAGLAPPPR